MVTIWYVARAGWRVRWRSWLALAALAGAAGGVTLAAVAGWYRTSTVQDRGSDAARPPDTFVQVPTSPAGLADADRLAELRRLPQIEVAGEFVTLSMTPAAIGVASEDLVTVTAPVDGGFGREVVRPRSVEGRRADPTRWDELEVNEEFADRLDVEVGDRVRFVSLTPDENRRATATGAWPDEPHGPAVTLRLVGIVRGPADILPGSRDNFPAVVTPAFTARYAAEMGRFEGSVPVRLRRGAADVDAFTDAVRRIYGDDPNLFVNDTSGDDELQAGLDDALRVPQVAIALFALIAGLAGAVTVGQALARQLAAVSSDQATLRALGLTRGERTLVGLAPAAIVAVAGAGVAVALAVAASPLFPFGFAARAEPAPGVRADWAVLAAGAVSVALVVLALAAAVAWRSAAGRDRGSDPSGAARGSTVAQWLARTRISVPAITGVRMALERGRGRTAVPVRQALLATVAGVGAVVAAGVVGASLVRTVDTPALYGWNWDAGVRGRGGLAATRDFAAELAGRPDVADATVIDFAFLRAGEATVSGYGFAQVAGSIGPTVVDGRAPAGAGEVAFGSDTLDRLGLGMGDTLTVESRAGPVEVRVVGRVAIPVIDSDAPAEGAVFARDLEALRPETEGSEGYQQVALRFEPGVDAGRAADRLRDAGMSVVGPQRPLDVSNLRQVRSVPYALAAVLGLLATAALVHLLFSGVRRRRRDLAVLRALGFVGRQVAVAVIWQATTIATVGLAVGIPLGLATGRLVWRAMADAIGVVHDASAPALVLALTAPGVLVVANGVAAVPARAARRARPADVLRSE